MNGTAFLCFLLLGLGALFLVGAIWAGQEDFPFLAAGLGVIGVILFAASGGVAFA